MGWFIKKQNTELQESLKVSFEHVKNDVKNLQAWVHHLNQQNNYKHQVIEHLRAQIGRLEQQREKAFKLTRTEIRDLIDRYYSLEPVVDRIQKLETEVAKKERPPMALPEQKQDLSPIIERLADISGKMAQLEHRRVPETRIQAPQTSHLKEKVVREVARRSKDYVKNVIHNLIQKYEKASGLQLREIVVEEQKLVSKSSFYRLLQELEDDRRISVLHRGKEKIYSSIGQPVETFK